jgi:hypothetical protein
MMDADCVVVAAGGRSVLVAVVPGALVAAWGVVSEVGAACRQAPKHSVSRSPIVQRLRSNSRSPLCGAPKPVIDLV